MVIKCGCGPSELVVQSKIKEVDGAGPGLLPESIWIPIQETLGAKAEFE